MSDRLDSIIDELSGAAPTTARPGKVASPEGTTLGATRYRNADAGAPLPPDVDGLFGASKAYTKYQKEKFEHRLMLWYKLQGFSHVEVAKILGYTPQTVSNVSKQPWFQTAFCELAKEMGKDAIQTFLEGEVLPALERVTELARSGDGAVKLAANREILDRFLGKSVAKVETKSSGTMDVTVYDAAKLQEEFKRNQEILNGRGMGAN